MATATPGPASATPAPVKYIASIYPGKPHEVPLGLADCILKLEQALGIPVWLLIQSGGEGNFEDLDHATKIGFCSPKSGLPKGQQIALIVDCPGGTAQFAYQIARHI